MVCKHTIGTFKDDQKGAAPYLLYLLALYVWAGFVAHVPLFFAADFRKTPAPLSALRAPGLGRIFSGL